MNFPSPTIEMDYPKFIDNELFEDLTNLGWEYESDEDGFGSLHFIVLMDKTSGVAMDFLIDSKVSGLLFYSEFSINEGGARIDHPPQNNGRPCLLKDLVGFVKPYLVRADNLEINPMWG